MNRSRYLNIESSLLNVERFNSINVTPRPRRGFTLIELLLVISILSILMGFLFASLKAVRRYTREVSTRTELAHLEAAFLQYFDHYGEWPVSESTSKEGDIIIDEEMIEILSGKSGNDRNPDQIPFIGIFRINSDKQAVNAWGDAIGKPYYVRFDFTGDNTISHPIVGLEDEVIHRSVIVWTENPERIKDANLVKSILGSWQQ